MAIKIFGYGSLVNRQSLLRTSPEAADIRTAYVRGFRRSFNLWDERGLTAKSHGRLRGQPFCALDVEESAGGVVNGVVFTIAGSLADIKSREYMYRLIEAEAFDFASHQSLGPVLVFSAGRNDGSYAMDSPAQGRYLAMCLAGAKAYGQPFCDQFLATTYIGRKPLADWPELAGLGRDYCDRLD